MVGGTRIPSLWCIKAMITMSLSPGTGADNVCLFMCVCLFDLACVFLSVRFYV